MYRYFRLADVELDATRGLVRRGDTETCLRQQALEVLLYLMQHAERVVTKEELFKAIWTDTAVTDDAVVQCVVEIRKALGDEVRTPRFIRTVPKLGYRFVAPVEPVAAPPASAATPAIALAPTTPEVVNGAAATVQRVAGVQSAADSGGGGRRPGTPRQWSARSVIALVAAGLVLVVAASLFLRPRQMQTDAAVVDPRLDATPGLRRLAVASFDDQTKDGTYAWLRRGLPDMLVTSFSQLPGVAVLGRQHTDLLFDRVGVKKDSEAPLDQALAAARRGNAEVLVLGSFVTLGGTLRIDARVYDVATGALLASHSVTANDPAAILTETETLAGRIATTFDRKPRLRTRVIDVMTDKLEAYRWYVLGLDKAQGLESYDAVQCFQKAVAVDPQFAAAYARIGFTYAMIAGDATRARPYLEKAFELSGRLTDQERANIAAWYAVAQLDFPAAIDAYRRLLSAYPENLEAYWRLGVLLAGEERHDEAVKVLERGLALDGDYAVLHNALGGAYLSLRQFARAIQTYERYVALAPERPNAYDSLGQAYEASGDYARAIATYEHALSLSPNFEIALVHLGNAYYRLGRYRQALATYDRYIAAAQSDSVRVRGRTYKAWVEYRRGNVAEAWKEISAIAERHGPGSEGITIALELNRPIADDWYKKVTAVVWGGRGTRTSRRITRQLDGVYALHRGKVDEALQRFSEVVRAGTIVYHLEDFEDSLADAYLELGRFAEAIPEYERVLGINPHRAMTRFHYAQALEGAGRIDLATAAYRAALDEWRQADPDVPELVVARQRVAALAH